MRFIFVASCDHKNVSKTKNTRFTVTQLLYEYTSFLTCDFRIIIALYTHACSDQECTRTEFDFQLLPNSSLSFYLAKVICNYSYVTHYCQHSINIYKYKILTMVKVYWKKQHNHYILEVNKLHVPQIGYSMINFRRSLKIFSMRLQNSSFWSFGSSLNCSIHFFTPTRKWQYNS